MNAGLFFGASSCIVKQNLLLMCRHSMKGAEDINVDVDFQLSCMKIMITFCDKVAHAAEGLAASAPSLAAKKMKKRGKTCQAAKVESFKSFFEAIFNFI
jgi:hypothetical protein